MQLHNYFLNAMYNAVHIPGSTHLSSQMTLLLKILWATVIKDDSFLLTSLVWGWKWCIHDLSDMYEPRKSSLASYWASRFLQCQDTSASVNMPADIYLVFQNSDLCFVLHNSYIHRKRVTSCHLGSNILLRPFFKHAQHIYSFFATGNIIVHRPVYANEKIKVCVSCKCWIF